MVHDLVDQHRGCAEPLDHKRQKTERGENPTEQAKATESETGLVKAKWAAAEK
jgi:hypothetical protein